MNSGDMGMVTNVGQKRTSMGFGGPLPKGYLAP